MQKIYLLLAVVPLVSACGNAGFRPLYGPTPSGAALEDRLKELDVAQIPGRVGQRIRNELIFHTSGADGEPVPPTHRLEIATNETLVSTLVSKNGEASGQIYALRANFKLIRIKDKKVMLEGVSYGRAAFERFPNTTGPPIANQWTYSNVRARENAENRAARDVANDLKTRVSIYFSGAG